MTCKYTHAAIYTCPMEPSQRSCSCHDAVEKSLFFPFVSWPLNLNEHCRQSQRQPLPLRRPVSKNKTTPLTEMANYSVWPLLKYLMIFTSRQKCPGVIELPPWTFIGVMAASPTTCRREVKQATIVCGVGLLRVRGFGSQTGTVSQCWAVRVFVLWGLEKIRTAGVTT